MTRDHDRSTPRPCSTVIIGLDTHSDFHVAAALFDLGRLLGSGTFATTPTGSD